MKQRIIWIDYVKVICIYLMVACHVGQEFFNPVWVYQFHMPAFFIVSGMLFKVRPIWKDIKSFAIPVIFCSAINLGVNILYAIHSYGLDIENFQSEGIIYCKIINWMESFWIFTEGELFPGIWFVVSLLGMRILFSFNWCYKHALYIAFVSCFWMGLSPYLIDDAYVAQYHLYHIFASIPFFVTGFLMRQYPGYLQKALDCRFEIKLLLCIVFICVCEIQGYCAILENSYGYNYIIYMLNAINGSYLLICACRNLPKRNFIINLSCGTFIILGLHRTLSACNVIVIFNQFGIDGVFVPLLNAALIMLWLYLPIRWLCKRYPIILGK